MSLVFPDSKEELIVVRKNEQGQYVVVDQGTPSVQACLQATKKSVVRMFEQNFWTFLACIGFLVVTVLLLYMRVTGKSAKELFQQQGIVIDELVQKKPKIEEVEEEEEVEEIVEEIEEIVYVDDEELPDTEILPV